MPLNSKFNKQSVDHINNNYKSHNPDKNFKAHILTKDDFTKTKFLQVDALWNPTDINETVQISYL